MDIGRVILNGFPKHTPNGLREYAPENVVASVTLLRFFRECAFDLLSLLAH